jgi:hypothetical protein
MPGAYMGARSRSRDAEICSACGTAEALADFQGQDLAAEVWPVRDGPHPVAGAAAVLGIDGADYELHVDRTAEAQRRDSEHVTFSAEAMDSLGREMLLFVLTRTLRAANAGRPPQRMTVQLHVSLDGQPAQ